MRDHEGFPPVDVAVIGAGMAGLSTAVYARLSGLSTRVFERHAAPGGLCTAWKRNGFYFDYCVQWFMGSGKEQGFYSIWKDLGVIDATVFRHIDTFGRYLAPDGQSLDLFTDPRRLQDHMLSIAPEDTGKIHSFCHAIRKTRHFLMSEFSLSLKGLSALVRSLPSVSGMTRWAGVSVREWCDGLRNPLLREAIPALVGADVPMAGPILAFGMMDTDNATYPLGGSRLLVRAVEARAKALGAEFVYSAAAKHVVFEGDTVVGVVLHDGRVQRARHVVAACDARTAFDGLLQGRVRDPIYEAMYDRREIYPAIVQVSLGVRIDAAWRLSEMPESLSIPLASPIAVGGREHRRIGIHHYAHDPHMAREGRTVILARFEADYDHWKRLSADPVAYESEKAGILEETVRALEDPFPGIRERVEASDVATPTTCERYTGNWRGSTQGWMITAEWMKKLLKGAHLPTTFAGARNFHLIGQWTEPGGGLPPCARNGRDVVRTIRKMI